MNSIVTANSSSFPESNWQTRYQEIIDLLKSGSASHVVAKALASTRDFPKVYELWEILGTVSRENGQGTLAIAAFQQAVSLNSGEATSHSNLAVALHEDGRVADAVKRLHKAIAINPTCAEAHYNLGVMLRDSGQLSEAIEAYRLALELNPEVAETYNNLGIILCSKGQVAEGIDAYKKALTIRPAYVEAAFNLGAELSKIQFTSSDPSLYPCLVGLLESKFLVTPSDIAPAILSLLRRDPLVTDCLDKKASNLSLENALDLISQLEQVPLLHKLMRATPLVDVDMELLFTNIRSVLLEHISDLPDAPFLIAFQCSLSLHCFTNEYVYFENKRDRENITVLQQKINSAVADGLEPVLMEVLCLSSFRPLTELAWGEKLTSLNRVPEVKERIISEPAREKKIAKEIPLLKQISDETSISVMDQYEANPYPRWVDTGLNPRLLLSEEHLREQDIRRIAPECAGDSSPKILIAGCGTGQHALRVVTRYESAKILAVDLSRSSLAYAKRKAVEAGAADITFVQADILDLDQLEDRFDIVECIGVLHHMHNPLDGWKVLVRLMAPMGLMKVGLYSEIARQDVVKTREEIASTGLIADADRIRSVRHDIMRSEEPHHQRLAESRDFFSLSETRDMLFHSQEHRFTIPRILDFLSSLGLRFNGFSDQELVKKFERQNREHGDKSDLGLWDKFEKEYPDSFRSMYVFWCQRESDAKSIQ